MPYEERREGREGREYREGGMSVKARLRAKARKKNRKGKKRGFARVKVSRLTTDKTLVVDYKDHKLLRDLLFAKIVLNHAISLMGKSIAPLLLERLREAIRVAWSSLRGDAGNSDDDSDAPGGGTLKASKDNSGKRSSAEVRKTISVS